MARYTGPKRRLERRENATLFSSDKWKKRPTLPGQHPVQRSRPSEYATQFREKQKVKRIYGLLEKQFRRVIEKSMSTKGNTGTIILQELEMRLDNIVFRLGLAKTRMQARQFVNHGHVLVNGSKVSIPSYRVNIGDKIELKDKIFASDSGKIRQEELKEFNVPSWLSSNKAGGKVASMPSRSELDQTIDERLIVEFYSRKL